MHLTSRLVYHRCNELIALSAILPFVSKPRRMILNTETTTSLGGLSESSSKRGGGRARLALKKDSPASTAYLTQRSPKYNHQSTRTGGYDLVLRTVNAICVYHDYI